MAYYYKIGSYLYFKKIISMVSIHCLLYVSL